MNQSTLCSLSRIGTNLVRYFHRTNCLRLDPKNVEEIRIPVPWGHVAGEWWGNKDKEPIIALHGWQDNCRTWEPLMHVLPQDSSVLTIDFPGNGLSSHYPHFYSYSFLDSVYIVRIIQKYLKLKDFVILGHSGGSATSFLFASAFPDSIRGYLGIDFLTYAYRSDEKRANKMIEIVDRKIELGLRDHKYSPTYEWDVAKQAIIKATRGSINPVTAEILMKRGLTKQSDGKYSYNRDGRVKSPAFESISIKQAELLASNVSCHVRLMNGSKSKFFYGGIKNCPQILDIIKSKAKSYELHTIDGNHHFHMDSPEQIAPVLLDLLKTVG